MLFAKKRNKQNHVAQVVAIGLFTVLLALLLAASFVALHHCEHEHCHLCLMQKGIYAVLLFAGWWGIRRGLTKVTVVSKMRSTCHHTAQSFALRFIRLNC